MKEPGSSPRRAGRAPASPTARRRARAASVLLAATCIVVAGSARHAGAQLPALVRDPVAPPTPTEPSADTESAAAVVRTMTDAITRAVRSYRETGLAQPLVVGAVTAYPFGHGTPMLTCTPLRACTIELEAGEVLVHGPIAGDVHRWRIAPAAAGAAGRSTIVVVKPTDCAITTNVVLSTDRRLYDLTLDAPPCSAGTTNPAGQIGRHVRFYYPDDTAAAATEVVARVDTVGIRIVALNRNYSVPRKAKFPWRPAEVFDDGAHVYIRVPESARHQAAPVLYALEEDGSRVLVNYTLRGDTYVTDRTFRRGLLVLGSGRNEQTLELENRAWGAERLPAPPEER